MCQYTDSRISLVPEDDHHTNMTILPPPAPTFPVDLGIEIIVWPHTHAFNTWPE